MISGTSKISLNLGHVNGHSWHAHDLALLERELVRCAVLGPRFRRELV